MASPYSSSFDAFGAEEIGALIALLEAMDADLAARRITARNGEVRSLVKLRIGASRRLQEWLGHYALTPRATAAPAHSSCSGCTTKATTVQLDPSLKGDHRQATIDNTRSACRHCHGVIDAPRSQPRSGLRS